MGWGARMADVSWQEIWAGFVWRVRESAVPGQPVETGWLALGCVVALGCVLVPSAWRLTRTLVTVVHESGHALVGLACGRRFLGFRVNTDMSGETVTAGRPSGPGRVVTTAAGYPMPALVGACLVAVGLHGWAGLVLLVSWAVLAVVGFHARSPYTVLTVVVLLAAVGALWWAGGGELRSAVVCSTGVFLVLGGWRGWFSVARTRDPRQDPGALASLTHIPQFVWNALFALVMAALSWWTVTMVAAPLRAAVEALLP